MRKRYVLVSVAFLAVHLCFSEESVATRRILPEDVVQESVTQWRVSTNKYVVRWIYTDAGAKKMLAFREANEGRNVLTVIGTFDRVGTVAAFVAMPPTFTNYAQWKEGWLKERTDKAYGVSEDDAKKIVAGFKSK